MARYNPNVIGSNAAILLLPKSDQRFIVGEPKTFARKKVEDGIEKDIFGVSYGLRVKGGDYADKTIPLQFYMHTEGGLGMAKQFVMAACGFEITPEAEAEFNSVYADADWSLDPETGELGDMWRKPAGSLVDASVDQKANRNNPAQMNQTFKWRPAK